MTDEQTIKDAWRRARGWRVDGEVMNVAPRPAFSVTPPPLRDDAPMFEKIEPVRFHKEYLREGPCTAVRVVGRYKDTTIVVEKP